jgi:hypothetical protein
MPEMEVRAPEEPICDFCSQPNPTRFFEAPDFPMDGAHDGLPAYRSRGAWAACATCGSMIDAENWDSLLLRAVDRLQPKYGTVPRRILVDTVRRSHDLFRKYYRKAP